GARDELTTPQRAVRVASVRPVDGYPREAAIHLVANVLQLLHLSSSGSRERVAYGRPMAQRVALVTGAGGGMGRAIALELAAAGQAVAAADIRAADAADPAAAVRDAGGEAVEVLVDV